MLNTTTTVIRVEMVLKNFDLQSLQRLRLGAEKLRILEILPPCRQK